MQIWKRSFLGGTINRTWRTEDVKGWIVFPAFGAALRLMDRWPIGTLVGSRLPLRSSGWTNHSSRITKRWDSTTIYDRVEKWSLNPFKVVLFSYFLKYIVFIFKIVLCKCIKNLKNGWVVWSGNKMTIDERGGRTENKYFNWWLHQPVTDFTGVLIQKWTLCWIAGVANVEDAQRHFWNMTSAQAIL